MAAASVKRIGRGAAEMVRYDRKARIIAICLSALAGYVDAVGFVGSGGFFVSFMSGNSTRLGVGVINSKAFALTALLLVGAFISGVVVSTLAGRLAGDNRQAGQLLLVTFTLALAALLAPVLPPMVVFPIVAFAMGAENLLFEANGEVRIGLTYMTGTLVKIGQRIGAALTGGNPWGWAPFLLLWLGLISGGIAGAWTYSQVGLASLWPAVLLAGVITVVVKLSPVEHG